MGRDTEMGDAPSAPSLALLPAEILTTIVNFADHKDLKSLRLSCRAFVQDTTSLLFRQIYISKLWRDRESFLSIAATPHLAAAVRSIVWLEMVGSVRDLNILYHESEHCLPDGPEPPAVEIAVEYPPVVNWPELPEDENNLYQHLFHQSSSLFWLHIPRRADPWPIFENITEESDALDSSIEEFRAVFYDALLRMPGVSTLVSQPMHPFRRLSSNKDHYPITAQMFYGNSKIRPLYCSYGHIAFLETSMQRLVSEGMTAPLITRMHFADEDTRAIPSFTGAVFYGSLIDENAFANLTHLDLCLVPCGFGEAHGNQWERLGESLTKITVGVPLLTHLRLCFERRIREPDDGEPWAPFMFPPPADLLQKYLSWMPRLVCLYLDTIPITVDVLVDVITWHKDTLLDLEVIVDPEFPHYPRYVDLSHIEGLQLRRYVVEVDEEDDPIMPYGDELLSVRLIPSSGAYEPSSSEDDEPLEYDSEWSDEDVDNDEL